MSETLVIENPARVLVPVVESDARFPINRIFCVGRNYAAHAREMGGNPEGEKPFFFAKPGDTAVAGSNCEVNYPSKTQDLHHEVEVVVAIKKGGANIAIEDTVSHVYGLAVGLDFTRRDMQAEVKAKGRPWDMAKGFDDSAVVGPILPLGEGTLPLSGEVKLDVNGKQQQKGDLSDMICNIAEVIADLSSYLTLQPGDLIYTGTPEGVGPVVSGDKLVARAAGLPDLDVTIR